MVIRAESVTDPTPRKATAFRGSTLLNSTIIRKLNSGRTGISQINVVIFYKFSFSLGSLNLLIASASSVRK